MADLLASDEPRRLADFLRENKEEILAHWESQVRKVRAAQTLDRPVLLDHLSEFIEDLAAYVDEVRTGHEVEPPEDAPQIHALERLEVGYELSEVVAEYSILRRCITELATRRHTPALRSAELPRLHEAIDQAISTSVVRYAEARERTLRALDRKLGTRLSVYGWSFYFGSARPPEPPEDWINVCVRCGSGHSVSFLRERAAVSPSPRSAEWYRCPACGGLNLLSRE